MENVYNQRYFIKRDQQSEVRGRDGRKGYGGRPPEVMGRWMVVRERGEGKG